jgi:hypothetical protein
MYPSIQPSISNKGQKSMNSTAQRMEALEQQVRHQRHWNLALGAVIVVGGLLAATHSPSVPEVMQAKRFEVVNDDGKVMVLLNSMEHDGETFGFVKTQNGQGGTLVTLTANAEGNGFLKTQDGNGGTLVAISATVGGEGVVKTQNGKGQILVQLGTTVEGEGMVKTQNGQGGTLVKIGTYKGVRGGYVETFDQRGAPTSEIPE